MLLPYKFPIIRRRVKGELDSLPLIQSFVNYIMLEIVLPAKNRANTVFTIDMVEISRYKEIIENINSEYLLNPIKEMYSICKSLDRRHIGLLRKAILNNNRIEELCEGKLCPVRYSDLSKEFINEPEKKLLKDLRVFCNYLYNKALRLEPIKDKYDDIKEYYNSILETDSICHFCGRPIMNTKYNSARNAFDHYLAKSIYPFVSINFHNLVPTCDDCNSKAKKQNDILYNGKKRVKAFYPFTKKYYEIVINIKLNKSYSENLRPSDIDLSCKCDGYQEEAENWMRAYNIVERYKAICCTEFYDDMEMIFAGVKVYKMNVDEILSKLYIRKYKKMNFLKVPFLKAACENINLK